MELIITLAMKFWQWTVLIAVVIIAAIINVFDKKQKPNLKFNFKGMPKLQPVPNKTKGKGFWGAIIMWLLSTRNWVLTDDWKYNIDGKDYVIPAGFQFDEPIHFYLMSSNHRINELLEQTHLKQVPIFAQRDRPDSTPRFGLQTLHRHI